MSMYYERVRATMDRRGASEGVDKATIGDIVNTIIGIDDYDIARMFFVSYVDYLVDRIDSDPEWVTDRDGVPVDADTTRKKAAWLAQQNIGWCYGEGMTQPQVDAWARATEQYGKHAEHPAFGTKLPDGSPEATLRLLEAGIRMGQAGGYPWKGKR